VVGYGKTPRLIHRDDMHYTKAFLLESLRMSSIVILALPHFALENVSVGPYIIPKGATVLPSIMNVLMDPEYFSDPHKFDPSRFLDQNNEFQHDEHVIAFSVGKRYCLGQSLAEKEFFLFFTGLMQRFDMNQSPGEILPSYHIEDSQSSGTIRSAPAYNVILSHRICSI
jgi:cytochrome P450